jgi:hypothetical protein
MRSSGAAEDLMPGNASISLFIIVRGTPKPQRHRDTEENARKIPLG